MLCSLHCGTVQNDPDKSIRAPLCVPQQPQCQLTVDSFTNTNLYWSSSTDSSEPLRCAPSKSAPVVTKCTYSGGAAACASACMHTYVRAGSQGFDGCARLLLCASIARSAVHSAHAYVHGLTACTL